jgi:Fe2+ transport system protein FeoA
MEVLNIQENIFLLSKLAYLVQKEPDVKSYIVPISEKNSVNDLLSKLITTGNVKTHWINWAKFDDKTIEVGINKFVKEILVEKFKPNSGIVRMSRLKHHYSPQFYELFQNLPLEITPEELKRELGIVDKYNRYYDLKKKVILPSLQDLEKIDMSVELSEIKKGKKVAKLLFTKGVKMNVSEMKIGQIGVIKKITATEPLKSRLYSLGIVKGEKIKVLKHTIAKNTFEVEVNKSRIALREDEAKMILVEVKQ